MMTGAVYNQKFWETVSRNQHVFKVSRGLYCEAGGEDVLWMVKDGHL